MGSKKIKIFGIPIFEIGENQDDILVNEIISLIDEYDETNLNDHSNKAKLKRLAALIKMKYKMIKDKKKKELVKEYAKKSSFLLY